MGAEFCLPFGAITLGAFYIFAGISRWDLSKLEKWIPKSFGGMLVRFIMGNGTRWKWQIGLGVLMLAAGIYGFYLVMTGLF